MMALCDQWWIPGKTGLNRSRHSLLPLLFDSETGTGRLVSRDSWDPLDGVKDQEAACCEDRAVNVVHAAHLVDTLEQSK